MLGYMCGKNWTFDGLKEKILTVIICLKVKKWYWISRKKKRIRGENFTWEILFAWEKKKENVLIDASVNQL